MKGTGLIPRLQHFFIGANNKYWCLTTSRLCACVCRGAWLGTSNRLQELEEKALLNHSHKVLVLKKKHEHLNLQLDFTV